MTQFSEDQAADSQAIAADIVNRELLFPLPPDLPEQGALVRLAEGVVGEILVWLDRNPMSDSSMGDSRVALVELRDSALQIPGRPELEIQQIVSEDEMTILRRKPSEALLRRWLENLKGPFAAA